MSTQSEKLFLRKVFLERCTHCDQPCGIESNFCSFCGVKNKEFDEAEMIRFEGTTLAEALSECRTGHDPTPDLPDIQYCSFCGGQLRILWPITRETN